jgi:transcriptional regulator with XRE-family HTH domain
MSTTLTIVKENVNYCLNNLCDDIFMDLSDRMKALMAEKGIRPPALSKYLKKPPATVHGWLSGRVARISYDLLDDVAQFFGVNAKWLNTGEGPKYPVSAHKHQVDAAMKAAVLDAEYEKSYLDEMINLCDRLLEQQAFPKGQDLELYQMADAIVEYYKQEHGGVYPTLSTLEFLLGKEIKKRQSN